VTFPGPTGYKCPLTLDGWLEFNRYKWDVKPLMVRLSEEGKELPAIEAVLYLNRRGRIVQPPLNPYLPVSFYITPTEKMSRIYRQRASLNKLLVEEFIRRGTKGSVTFPPEMFDVRQWQWNGFLTQVRYTFFIDLPYSIALSDYSVRKHVNKARRKGFTCERGTKDMFAEVIACLAETEARQRFSYRLNVKDLELALSLLGEESFRIYVCRSNSGEVASARIILSAPGLRAIDWVAGTKKQFLSSGATQLVILYALTDLAEQKAIGFDFAGANLPTVSAAKTVWGGKLKSYYVVSPFNLRTLGALGFKVGHQIRRRKLVSYCL